MPYRIEQESGSETIGSARICIYSEEGQNVESAADPGVRQVDAAEPTSLSSVFASQGSLRDPPE